MAVAARLPVDLVREYSRARNARAMPVLQKTTGKIERRRESTVRESREYMTPDTTHPYPGCVPSCAICCFGGRRKLVNSCARTLPSGSAAGTLATAANPAFFEDLVLTIRRGAVMRVASLNASVSIPCALILCALAVSGCA